MDDAVLTADAAVATLFDAAVIELLAIASSSDTASKRLKDITDVCKDLVPYVARPFNVSQGTNETNIKLWAKHPDDTVNVAILRAIFRDGNDTREQIRLIVRQALAWEYNRAFDPAELPA